MPHQLPQLKAPSAPRASCPPECDFVHPKPPRNRQSLGLEAWIALEVVVSEGKARARGRIPSRAVTEPSTQPYGTTAPALRVAARASSPTDCCNPDLLLSGKQPTPRTWNGNWYSFPVGGSGRISLICPAARSSRWRAASGFGGGTTAPRGSWPTSKNTSRRPWPYGRCCGSRNGS